MPPEAITDARARMARGRLLEQVRVPTDHYRSNLTAINDVASTIGAPVVFMTAPTSHYRNGFPDYLVDFDFVRDKALAMRTHKE